MPASDKKQTKKQVEQEESDSEELCFICTEPVITYAVGECDHRTCHRCALRLRALYETKNCTYCKAEQTVVIFTKEAEKPFDDYVESDTPFVDKKLNIKFETQDMYRDSIHMLKHNCPEKDCAECSDNWPELKLHVRKEHNLNFCDLCIDHKKVFPFEHILYTSEQLIQHYKEGDKKFIKNDESGFSGHPECQFCKKYFFGSDELYVHCRDNHEQCFLCVRNGVRHQYYVNYASLEQHFKKDHYMCLYPQCLEKKFIVFDSSIDLIGHEVEVHGESTSGLQRSMQMGARRIDLNFQYDQPRPSRANGNRNENIRSNSTGTSSSASLSANDFPSIQRTAGSSNVTVATQSRAVPGALSRKKDKQKAVQKPTGFGALSPVETGSPSTSGTVTPDATGSSTVETPVVASHAAFLAKLEDILQSKQKVTEFRKLTGAFRKGTIDADAYVNQVVLLTNSHVEKSNKIFKGVENLLDIEEKKWEMIRAWRNKHTAMTQFPALESSGRPSSSTIKKSRVLVIKDTKTNKPNKSVQKTAWSSSNGSSRSSSSSSSSTTTYSKSTKKSTSNSNNNNNNNNNESSTSRHSSPTSTPSSSTPTLLENQAFPSLPTAAPKHREVLNIRRNTQRTQNAWDGNTSQIEEDDQVIDSSIDKKKKKGRKNKVLLRVGL